MLYVIKSKRADENDNFSPTDNKQNTDNNTWHRWIILYWHVIFFLFTNPQDHFILQFNNIKDLFLFLFSLLKFTKESMTWFTNIIQLTTHDSCHVTLCTFINEKDHFWDRIILKSGTSWNLKINSRYLPAPFYTNHYIC